VLAFFQFLKRAAPGFADSYIVDIPPQIGIRETRRVTGRYQLSGDDVVSCASFADTIGSTAGRSRPMWRATRNGAGPTSPARAGFNHLPYRMLVPPRPRNLLVAGRCASMTHEGQSAARVSGGCFVMGEAAGRRGASRAGGQRRPGRHPDRGLAGAARTWRRLSRERHPISLMCGLVPRIHVAARRKTWMAGTIGER